MVKKDMLKTRTDVLRWWQKLSITPSRDEYEKFKSLLSPQLKVVEKDLGNNHIEVILPELNVIVNFVKGIGVAVSSYK